MHAIRVTTYKTNSPLQGKTHWWGFPDLPDGVEYPVNGDSDGEDDEDTMTFICQINLQDIAQFDTDRLLPSKGMLYFFANIDYFLGDLEADCEGLGFWDCKAFKVIYDPSCDNLRTHKVYWPDGSPACRPAEAINFGPTNEDEDGHKLLGTPFFEEVCQEAPGMISLLQIDCDDDWGLQLFDMGNLNFLISKEALKARDFSKVKLYFHSA